MRQGPHHEAQKSITTGADRDCSITSRWKFCAVASITNESPFVNVTHHQEFPQFAKAESRGAILA